MAKTISIEKRIKAIEKRNKLVEADKAWERSLLRRAIIALITFVFIGLYLNWLDVSKPWLNALVPTIGFLLSTLVLQKLRTIWIDRQR